MAEHLTHFEFAQQCAYVAREACAWAGDTLILPEMVEQPMRPNDVARFTYRMRAHLDIIDRRAGREPTGGSDGQA